MTDGHIVIKKKNLSHKLKIHLINIQVFHKYVYALNVNGT